MSGETHLLLTEALKRLSDSERAELASELIASLDGPADSDAGAAWNVEIERRAAELESGAVKAIPWDEVESRIMRRLRAVRSP